MKQVRNPDKWIEEFSKTKEQYDKAIRQHRPRIDLEKELKSIMTGLVAYANRREG